MSVDLYQRYYKYGKIPQLLIFALHNPPGGYKVKIVNNGVVSRYPSRSVVYNVDVSGPAAVECTL